MIHIGHIDTETTWRGGERQALELMKGLAVRGVKNTLFCRTGSAIAQVARESGIDIVTLPLAGEWDISSALAIRRIIREQDIQIIHTHTSHAHTLGLLALARNRTCRLVVSRRVDFHVHNPLSRYLKYGPRVDRIITVSNAIERILIEDGIPASRITTVRSGFVPGDLADAGDIGNPRAEFGIPPEAIVITTVAALAPHKAHHDLLRAASFVVRKHPHARFLLAGEGKLRQCIERDIRNLNLGSNVSVLGFRNDLGTIYRASDLFALSSEEEGLCTSLLDAMYFKLPIVATSAGGIPELVQDKINGFIVPVHDYRAFAERLCYLIENPDRRRQMGERSFELLHGHTIETTIDRTYAIYMQLIAPKMR